MADIIYANKKKISKPADIPTNFHLGHDITKQLELKEDVAAPTIGTRILSKDDLRAVHVEKNTDGFVGNIFALTGEKEGLDRIFMRLFEFYNFKGYEQIEARKDRLSYE